MFALFVHGGEVLRFLGVMTSMEQVNARINTLRGEADLIKDAGYVRFDGRSESWPRMLGVYIHDQDRDSTEWEMMFQVITCEPGEEFDMHME